MHCSVFTREHSPCAIIVVVGWALLVGMVRHLWLEGALDVVLHQLTLPKCVLDRDLVVQARCVQELLEVVPGRCRLARVALSARRLALHCRDKVVIVAALVILLLLFEVRGRSLNMVHDLFPLALRGVECHGHRLLTVGVIARDVEEFPRRARHEMPESMDEVGTRRPVLECRDDIVVGCTGELGVALEEAPYVLAKALPGLLLAVEQLPLLAGVHVHALEVADEDPT
jgi:hypothetical protein